MAFLLLSSSSEYLQNFFIHIKRLCYRNLRISWTMNKSDSDIHGTYIYPRTTSTEWRRQRLLNIGNTAASSGSNETTTLSSSTPNFATYGTLPASRGKRLRKSLSPITIANFSRSNPNTPIWSSLHDGIRFRRSKTIASYDPPRSAYRIDNDAYLQDSRFSDTKLNGVRVWYSSFTSVDWLHDAIKESSRLWRIRSRKSLRGRLLSTLDKSIDWITVIIVGFLTAITAFLIVRSEQWLFDLKEGRCLQGWWNARRFCSDWQTWGTMIERIEDHQKPISWMGLGSWAAEYIIYALIAVRVYVYP